MLTIGARLSTLPETITALIFQDGRPTEFSAPTGHAVGDGNRRSHFRQCGHLSFRA